jgi:hypothetical protein
MIMWIAIAALAIAILALSISSRHPKHYDTIKVFEALGGETVLYTENGEETKFVARLGSIEKSCLADKYCTSSLDVRYKVSWHQKERVISEVIKELASKKKKK